MDNISSIEVGGITYNVAQAPANKQKKLLSLIGGRVAMNSAASGAESIDVQLLMGMLVSEPESRFDEIAGIVLAQAFKNGADTPVDVADFQNRVSEYYLLTAMAIKENLQDFFAWLDSVNAETRKKA
jgi:hypothetical protein